MNSTGTVKRVLDLLALPAGSSCHLALQPLNPGDMSVKLGTTNPLAAPEPSRRSVANFWSQLLSPSLSVDPGSVSLSALTNAEGSLRLADTRVPHPEQAITAWLVSIP